MTQREKDSLVDPRVTFYHDRKRVFAGFAPRVIQIPGGIDDYLSILDLQRMFKTVERFNIIDPSYASQFNVRKNLEEPPSLLSAQPARRDRRICAVIDELTPVEDLKIGKPYIVKASTMVNVATIGMYPLRYEEYPPDEPPQLTFIKELNAGTRGLYPKIVSDMKDGGFILVTSFEPEYHGPSPRQLPPDDISGQLTHVHRFNTSDPLHKTHYFFHFWSDLDAFRVKKKTY